MPRQVFYFNHYRSPPGIDNILVGYQPKHSYGLVFKRESIDRQTEGRYQTYYLSGFVVDKNQTTAFGTITIEDLHPFKHFF